MYCVTKVRLNLTFIIILYISLLNTVITAEITNFIVHYSNTVHRNQGSAE